MVQDHLFRMPPLLVMSDYEEALGPTKDTLERFWKLLGIPSFGGCCPHDLNRYMEVNR